MRYAARQPHGLARPCVDAFATDLHRQGAGGDQSFLVLEVMNVRTLQQRLFAAQRRSKIQMLS